MLVLNRILVLVLLELDRRERSASVTVQTGQAKRVVHVAEGYLVGVDSSLKAERLGDMLVGEGLLDEVLLEPVAAEAARRGVLLGQQLVSDGLLTSGDLLNALERQISCRTGLALSARGLVTVEPPVYLEPAPVQIPLLVAMFTAIRGFVSLEAIEDQLCTPEEDQEPALPADAHARRFDRLELGPAELRISQRLASGEGLADILKSGVPREPVLRLAGALSALGLWRWSPVS